MSSKIDPPKPPMYDFDAVDIVYCIFYCYNCVFLFNCYTSALIYVT